MDTQDLHPERLVKRGLRAVKARARRRDLVGNTAYRTLELLHGGLGATVETLGRIHEASEPPARGAQRAASPARRASRHRSARRSVATT